MMGQLSQLTHQGPVVQILTKLLADVTLKSYFEIWQIY